MKKALLIIGLLVLSLSAQASAQGLALESEQGSYELVEEGSGFYCSRIPKLELLVSGTQVQILLTNEENVVREELISDINTSHYTKYSDMTAVIYTRYVYKNNQLKSQESVWGLGFIPSAYKDKRVILEVLGDGRLVYNYKAFGSTMCHFVRVN